ncbi:MAG: hypothetical protein M1816_000247 [Peltula sp. TS41687]|nr:MAG: hypothetical protein M1816_000247 [Peltula sp. TS41687]
MSFSNAHLYSVERRRSWSNKREENIKNFENEKAIYRILMEDQHRHPNIGTAILCVPEGIFMRRYETTLESRLSQSTTLPINIDTQSRWIQQLVSAVVWLERLGHFHGDLWPANVLLDARDNIKLVDFAATVKKGEQLIAAADTWFCKLQGEIFELPIAGPTNEQFALGSFVYTIRFGYKPHHELDEATRVQKVIKNEFPATSADELLVSRLRGHPGELVEYPDSEIEQEQFLILLKECVEFLITEHLNPENGLPAHTKTGIDMNPLRACLLIFSLMSPGCIYVAVDCRSASISSVAKAENIARPEQLARSWLGLDYVA